MSRSGTRPTCSIPGCLLSHVAKGFCGKHYKRFKIHGDANINLTEQRQILLCRFPGCGKPIHGKGLCESHRRQQLRGNPLTALRSLSYGIVKFCRIPGCDRKVNSHGLCRSHRRHEMQGLPLTGARLHWNRSLKNYRRKIGDEYIDGHGYTHVFVGRRHLLATRAGLALKSHIEYQQINNVILEKGERIFFRDGNKRNFSPDNLYLKKSKRVVICGKCNKPFSIPLYRRNNINFCSIRCKNIATCCLSELQIIDIRLHFYAGIRLCKLAVAYGVSRGTVDCIVRGKTGKHVPLIKKGSHDEFMEAVAYRSRITNKSERKGGMEDITDCARTVEEQRVPERSMQQQARQSRRKAGEIQREICTRTKRYAPNDRALSELERLGKWEIGYSSRQNVQINQQASHRVGRFKAKARAKHGYGGTIQRSSASTESRPGKIAEAGKRKR